MYGRALVSCIAISTAWLAATPVMAQSALGGAVPSDGTENDIVVTAQKRESTLQNVPFSIAAQTGEQLRASGATNVVEMARNVAGLAIADLGPGQSQVAIRGVSSGQVARDETARKESVGVYLDESQISIALFTPDLDLFDLSRIEVLRGPQGTLFGAGSEAGTIRYITNQPNLSRIEGAAEAEATAIDQGSNGWSAKGALNLPIVTDKIAVRAVGYYDHFGGFIDAIGPAGRISRDVNDGRKYGGRIAIKFAPTEAISFTPRIVYQRLQTNGYPRTDIFNLFANPYTTTRAPVTLGPLEQYRQIPEGMDDRFLMADATLSVDLGGVTLTSVSSYTNRKVVVTQDSSTLMGQISSALLGLPGLATLDGALLNRTQLDVYTEEVRLASNGKGPFQWVVGGFFLDQNKHYGQNFRVAGFADGFNAATGAGLDGRPANPLSNDADVVYVSDAVVKLRQYSVFGEASYALTDRLTATAGLRYFDYRENRNLVYAGLLNCAADFINCAVDPSLRARQTKGSGISPRAILAYEVGNNVKLNAQVSKGFRLGGISDPLLAGICDADSASLGGVNLQSFKNETVWNYEAGVKSKIGRNVTFNASAYYIDINNLQVSVRLPCSATIILNVPKARTIGMEAEFNARLSDRFSFGANVSLNDSKVRSAVPLVNIQSGDRLPTSPRYQISTNFTYEAPVRDGVQLFGTGVIQFQSSSYSFLLDQRNNSQLPVTVQYGLPAGTTRSIAFPTELSAYAIGNMRVGLRSDAGWELALFVNNIWNEKAELALDRERGGDGRLSYIRNQPRTMGLNVRSSF